MEYAIGADIGGTKIEADLVNSRGKILFRNRVKTEAYKPKKQIINNIIEAITPVKNFANKKGVKVKGIGIGTPGFVLPNGKTVLIVNIPAFEGSNLIKDLEKKTKTRVFQDNDANCFALAEHMYGAAKNHNISICIIWGTGIGAGIIINDNIYSGSKGAAGEFGHSVIKPDAKIRCACGKKGDVESLCSAPNLVKYYKYYGGKKKGVDSTFIMNCSDAVARKVANQCINYLSVSIAMLVSTINPEIIVLGGGVSNSNHYKELNRLTNKYAAKSLKGTFKIVKHQIGDYAGVIGAAALVFKG